MSLFTDKLLVVNNLGKKYKLYQNSLSRLKEWLTLGTRSYHHDFWALREINFEVNKGDFIGVLGINGAGKSTLLRILSGVSFETEGSFSVTPKAISLLELGIGIKGDLTGRQNTLKRAEMLGYRITDVEKNIEDIKEFSELGEFFEYPVSRYSSGMKARLNFSTFAFFECDLLFLDEVLAVGDIFFKQKCYQRLKELVEKGTSIVLVTHSLKSVNQFCNKVLVLNKGKQVYWGETQQGLRLYSKIKHNGDLFNRNEKEKILTKRNNISFATPLIEAVQWQGDDFYWPLPEFFRANYAEVLASEMIALSEFAITNADGKISNVYIQGEQMIIYYSLEILGKVTDPLTVGTLLVDKYNNVIHGKDSLQYKINLPESYETGQRIRVRQTVELDIAIGTYALRVWCYQYRNERKQSLFSKNKVTSIEVVTGIETTTQAFYGYSNLTGDMVIQWQAEK